MRSTRLSLSPLAPRRHFTSTTCSSRRPNALLSCPYGVSRNRINHGKRAFTSSASRRRELEDYYKVLELPPQSTAGQIKTRYYELSKKYHPDVNQGADLAQYQNIQMAYSILGRPEARRDYDRKRVGAGSRQTGSQSHPSAQAASHASMRARRRETSRQQGVTWSNTTRSQPLEIGFAPRSSWHPEFRKFYDDWAAKMKENGLDPEKTTLGYDGRSPNPQFLEQMMNGDLLTQYMKKARAEGRDPLSSIFLSQAGRSSNAAQWLKNRMAMLEREQAVRSGGVWERGGAKRADTRSRHFSSNWGKGPTGARGPAYSSEGASAAEKLGGHGTGEETFNAPWDEPPRRGFQKEVPKPWWAAGASEGAQTHMYDTWSPSPAFDQPGAVKRDYTKGHRLDARFEEDRLRMVARERRMITVGAALVATMGVAAAWNALTGVDVGMTFSFGWK